MLVSANCAPVSGCLAVLAMALEQHLAVEGYNQSLQIDKNDMTTSW